MTDREQYEVREALARALATGNDQFIAGWEASKRECKAERDQLLEMARELRLSARVLATAQKCYPDPTGEAAEILAEVEESIAKFDAIHPPEPHPQFTPRAVAPASGRQQP